MHDLTVMSIKKAPGICIITIISQFALFGFDLFFILTLHDSGTIDCTGGYVSYHPRLDPCLIL
jgi:hypothetical protein